MSDSIITVMKTVWIIGLGVFGLKAFERLSTQHKSWQFVLVDNNVDRRIHLKGLNAVIKKTDGVKFLVDHLTPEAKVSWIIPSLPLHLAWEWCRAEIGSNNLLRAEVPLKIDALLTNPMHGENKDIYVSNADFICPDNCSEPDDFCTITQHPRRKDMCCQIRDLKCEDFLPIVLESRQIGPGVGGYSPAQLFDFLEEVKKNKGHLLLATACRCHGVITGARRV